MSDFMPFCPPVLPSPEALRRRKPGLTESSQQLRLRQKSVVSPAAGGRRRRSLGVVGVAAMALALAMGLRAAAPAAEPTNAPVRPVSLQECFALALSNNLDLQIERINPLLAGYDLEIARAGYDPLFTLAGDHSYTVQGAGLDENNRPYPASRSDANNLSSGLSGQGPMGLSYKLSGQVDQTYGTDFQRIPFDTSSGSVGFTLTQPLLKNFLIDSTRYNILVARNRLKASELGLEAQVISVITAIELAYYELIAATEYLRVQEEALRLAQRLYRENQLRVQIGSLARLDEKQAEAQMAASQADVSSARRALSTAQNNLKNLITDSYRALHPVSLQPTEKLLVLPQAVDLQESWNIGLAQRPDLRQARLDLERQGITVNYYKNQRLPEVNLVGGYGHNASGALLHEFGDAFNDFANGSKPFWSAGGVFSIPLSNKAARERYRQGKATAQQLLLSLKKQEQSVLIEIDDAVNQLRTSLDRVESTRQARLYAEQALDAEQKRLETGASTTFVVLRLQRDLTSARSEEIRARSDYNKAQATLRQAEGTTLQQKQISIQIR
jgi:outer membrane protein